MVGKRYGLSWVGQKMANLWEFQRPLLPTLMPDLGEFEDDQLSNLVVELTAAWATPMVGVYGKQAAKRGSIGSDPVSRKNGLQGTQVSGLQGFLEPFSIFEFV